VLAYSIIVFAMLRIYEPETPVREVVALRAIPVWVIALAGAIGACVYPALNVLDTFLERRFPPSAEELEIIGKLMTTTTLGRRVVVGVSFLVVMPGVDEIFFRGVLQGGLRRARSAPWAVVGAAVYFAGARADARSFASVFAFGLVLGWLRERSGSILATMAAQVAFFAVPVVPILGGRDAMADEVYPVAWIWGGAAVAAICAAVLEARARRAPADGGGAGDGGGPGTG
jgi:membrane protease YdiL (CAAX protease family)